MSLVNSPARQPLERNRQFLPGRKEIRLLVLEKTLGSSPDSPLRGRLCVADLDNEPEYRALSYFWGDHSSPKDVISCDGEDFEITTNCMLALRHLTKHFPCPLVVWIDAICIDQNNEDEKRHQIPLMSEIYSRALQVCIWLGPGTPETDTAMDFLRRGALPFRKFINQHIELPSGETMPTGLGLSLRIALRYYYHDGTWMGNLMDPETEKGVVELFQRPWIQRLWTLQEVILANDLVVLCGDKYVSWATLLMGIDSLAQRVTLAFVSTTKGVPIRGWWNLVETWKQYHAINSAWNSRPRQIVQSTSNHALAIQRGVAWGRKVTNGLTSLGILWNLTSTAWPAISIIFQHYADIGVVRYALLYLLAVFIVWSPILLARWVNQDRGTRTSRPYTGPVTVSETMLMELSTRQSRAPEDKYFGIYGLTNRAMTQRDRNARMPKQNSQPLHTIYRLLFEEMVNYSENLDILIFKSGHMSDGPSWVVDWTAPALFWFVALHTPHYPFSSIGSRPDSNPRPAWNTDALPGATYGSRAEWKFIGGKELRVRGRIVGNITWALGKFTFIDEFLAADFSRWYAVLITILIKASGGLEQETILGSLGFLWMLSWKCYIDDQGNTMESPDFKPLAQTMNWERYSHPFPAPLPGNLIRRMERVISRFTGNPRSSDQNGSGWAARILGRTVFPALRNTHAFYVTCYHRLLVLLRVEKTYLPDALEWMMVFVLLGAFNLSIVRCESRRGPRRQLDDFGPAPEAAREGDAVALIAGVSLPVVLRPMGRDGGAPGGYSVVGPAFFHSAMAGEVWDRLEGEPLEEIVLV